MAFPENRKQEYSIHLSHALYKVIQEAKEALFEKELALHSNTWRAGQIDIEKTVEVVLEEEALHILQHRLMVMLNEISADDRSFLYYSLPKGDKTLFRLATVDGTTFYTDTDILQCADGIYKIFLYPSKKAPPLLSKKIPAMLFVGAYGHFDCFDYAKYIISVYPGCFFTSARGVSWSAKATTDAKLFELIQQSAESVLQAVPPALPHSPRECD